MTTVRELMRAINDEPALVGLILSNDNPRREEQLTELGIVFDRHPLHEYLRIRSDRNPSTWRKYSTGLARAVVKRALIAYEDEPVMAMGGMALAEADEPDEADELEPDAVARSCFFFF